MIVNIVLAIIMLGLIYTGYRFFDAQLMSPGVYSVMLTIFGGAFFFFLQRLYAIKSEGAMKKLLSISEIRGLVEKAESKSEQIDNLEKEREKLEHIVEVSATKYYLGKRYRELENRLRSTYNDLVLLKKEIASLNIDIEGELTRKKIEEIEKFIGYRERRDLIIRIGKGRIAIPRKIFDIYPLGGAGLTILITAGFLKMIEKIFVRQKL